MRVLEAAGARFEWDPQIAGSRSPGEVRHAAPRAVLESIRRNKVALKGPVTTPIGEGFTSVNVGLRKALDLYANLRPVVEPARRPARFEGVDLVIVRENTEDLYAGLEHEVVPGVVESLKIITERASTRIARFAFEYARAARAQAGDGDPQGEHHEAQRRAVPRLRPHASRASTPTSTYDERIVDAACMQLVMQPDAVRRAGAAEPLRRHRVGSVRRPRRRPRRGRRANLGDEIAVFEAVHGSAPDIAGRNLANPTALLLSAVLMLHHLDKFDEADRAARRACGGSSCDQKILTRDLGGTATTTEFTEHIVRAIETAA